MKALLPRAQTLLAGLWAGMLLCIATIATPAPFAALAPADAGRVVGRMFAHEAYASLAVGLLLIVLERRRVRDADVGERGIALGTETLLALGAIFCTVAGYFALQPLMAAARSGHGSISPAALSFGALHAISFGFFALKGALVLALAWRFAGRSEPVKVAATPF